MKKKSNPFPRYKHDCSKCYFLGHHNEYDLYFCPEQVTGPTVIARYGIDGDYCSGMSFAETIEPLGIAKQRAIDCGLLVEGEG